MGKPRQRTSTTSRQRKPDSSASETNAAIASGDSERITAVLFEIRSQIGQLRSDQASTEPTDEFTSLASSVAHQTELLETLTDGLQLFEQRILERLEQTTTESAQLSAAENPEANMSAEEGQVTNEGPGESSVSDSWESIRRAMLDSSGLLEETTPTEEHGGEIPPKVLSGEATMTVEFELPPTVDPEAATHNELREAFLERENLLRSLASRLRQQSQSEQRISTEQLKELSDHGPEGLHQRLEESLTLLEEQLRLTELELSLERAQLGRQTTQLEESRCTIRNTAFQLGLTLNEDDTLEGIPDVDHAKRSGDRWKRVLGFGN